MCTGTKRSRSQRTLLKAVSRLCFPLRIFLFLCAMSAVLSSPRRQLILSKGLPRKPIPPKRPTHLHLVKLVAYCGGSWCSVHSLSTWLRPFANRCNTYCRCPSLHFPLSWGRLRPWHCSAHYQHQASWASRLSCFYRGQIGWIPPYEWPKRCRYCGSRCRWCAPTRTGNHAVANGRRLLSLCWSRKWDHLELRHLQSKLLIRQMWLLSLACLLGNALSNYFFN